ncbi:MAG: HEPN domain-containing protein [archaeon]|nr:HEPN domain-containing protein [archaeon]MCP8320400.1 HEPN domain-containing protein [archaeon]
MTTAATREFVTKSLQLAEEFLKDAELSFSRDRFRAAINNAYYTFHHSASACLAHLGIEPPKTHSGLISLFSREVVNKNLVDKSLGKNLRESFELRQKSTYEIYVMLEREDVEEVLRNAREFLSRIKELTKT